ncbi:unnamed protein product [Phyllotreta striolata]|uniref:NADPH-dependent diflavin oxidoreductase 1 n=1 Tax=Phyllotreta striolata TaxID=444603 RepID=A0A9N9XTV9_PHYSR|nr:unnamed protein product [Phyllotreta striolata]
MSFENQRIPVLYGSQTGNAQDLGERISREAKRFYFRSPASALDSYNIIELINEKCVVFVCSTTGQGEEPDNMKVFWKFLLKKSLPPDILSNLKFAVFGLGDSSYVKYNFTAKLLYKRLINLGAKPVIPLGLGDDQHDLGYDGTADPWIESLWGQLLQLFPLPANIIPLPKDYRIEPRWHAFKSDNVISNRNQSIYSNTRKNSDFIATVIENKRITSPDHFQDVRLIKFRCKDQSYNPGDVIVLRPKNLSWKIKEFQEVLTNNGVEIPPETVIDLAQKDVDIPVPDVLKYRVTFGQLCAEYFDLMSVPRRHTFQILAQLTDSELEKEKCLEFTTAEGQEDLYSYTYRPKRNIVEVLQDFPQATKNLTLDMMFELLPPIKPREFSIASSRKVHGDEVHVLLAVVKYKTRLVKERFGLGSNYLAGLKEGDEIMALIKKGSFKFPKELDIPVILVGPGTGVASFRSFVFEKSDENSHLNNPVLFFGCRYRNKDFLCKEDFQRLASRNKLKLITAFSRDEDHKVYVQDKIKENGPLVWELLQNEARIFVAGSSKNMPQGVRKAFLDVCQEAGGLSPEESTKFIEKLEKIGRYQTECWS